MMGLISDQESMRSWSSEMMARNARRIFFSQSFQGSVTLRKIFLGKMMFALQAVYK